MIRQDQSGYGSIAVILIITLGYGLVVLHTVGFFGPVVPSDLTLSGPTTIPRGGSGTFTLSLTTKRLSSTPQTFTVAMEENDFWWDPDELLSVVRIAIPGEATSGSVSFALSCATDGTIADNTGWDREDEPYQIQAEFSRGIIPNLRSKNHQVECVAAKEHVGR